MSEKAAAEGKRTEKTAKLEEIIARYEEKLRSLEENTCRLNSAGRKRQEEGRDPFLEEYIDIKLYKGESGMMKEDVFVSINGENCIVPRGRWVKIKRKFALVIDQSEIQDQRTLEMLEAEAGKWERANA